MNQENSLKFVVNITSMWSAVVKFHIEHYHCDIQMQNKSQCDNANA